MPLRFAHPKLLCTDCKSAPAILLSNKIEKNKEMKHTKIIKLVLLSCVLIILYACPDFDYRHLFTFENNSGKDLFLYLGVAPRESGGCLYPDTLLTNEKVGYVFEKGKIQGWSFNFEFETNHDTLSLFILDNNIVKSYTWDFIKSEYKILCRYDISRQDFEYLKWTIPYPPNEHMKHMKMYPPYGQ